MKSAVRYNIHMITESIWFVMMDACYGKTDTTAVTALLVLGKHSDQQKERISCAVFCELMLLQL